MRWIESIEAARRGGLPCILVTRCESVPMRRPALRSFVAALLGRGVDNVTIVHCEGAAPRLLRPDGRRLVLSSASRAGFAAFAAAESRIGVDVEALEDIEPPWNILHGDERRLLSGLTPSDRARSFAKIWSAKEAYLKAAGVGLMTEPAAINVRLEASGAISIEPQGAEGPAPCVESRWMTDSGRSFVVSAVRLGAAFRP